MSHFRDCASRDTSQRSHRRTLGDRVSLGIRVFFSATSSKSRPIEGSTDITLPLIDFGIESSTWRLNLTAVIVAQMKRSLGRSATWDKIYIYIHLAVRYILVNATHCWRKKKRNKIHREEQQGSVNMEYHRYRKICFKDRPVLTTAMRRAS